MVYGIETAIKWFVYGFSLKCYDGDCEIATDDKTL